MASLYLLEPPPSDSWRPFIDSRPIAELRAGAWLIRERWQGVTDSETTAIFGPSHLHGFVEDGAPPVRAAEPVTGPAFVVRSDFAPTGIPLEEMDESVLLTNDDATVGWYVHDGETLDPSALPTDWDEVDVEGLPLHGAYDLVTALELFLEGDVGDFAGENTQEIPDGSIVIGEPDHLCLLGAFVEPGVVFDVRHGSVVLEQNVTVRSGTRFEGPTYIGPGAEIVGGEIKRTSVGPRCRVRGEVQACVFLGYANKGHEGFLGHSAVGRWVNLGAGTTTSNLKNTYGPVRLDVGGRRVETERQFLGTLFGDHAKTAIGTMLSTGTIIGTGANVFGNDRPGKFVPPFAWGLRDETMDREGFLRIAERVMPRRDVEVGKDVLDMLRAVYDHATT